MSYKNTEDASIGVPHPLGANRNAEGINFAIVSSVAKKVTLHLFEIGGNRPFASYKLHRTGQVWHIFVKTDLQELEYTYDILGKSVIDPYAKALSTGSKWGAEDLFSSTLRGKVQKSEPFDWEGITPPRHPLHTLVIYEMHLRGFTSHNSSRVTHPGTFLGLIEKIPHLKEIGVNAVELMPIFEFNECELKEPSLKNVWGYSTINFFSVMKRYGTEKEFKTLVKAMHQAGIEVYLDVVYNHTAEGNEEGPIFCFKGIDPSIYYLKDTKGHYLNFSGTGNTFNANHFVTAELILSSLRYFAFEMQVDGFRFDLASCLTRNTEGKPVKCPLLINMMTKDPLLKDVKLIAEAWDAAGLYQVGHFPGGARFLEWNGFYRDAIRKFIKGSDNAAGDFAQSLTGSSLLYGGKGSPLNSINFICCHDGFTLKDLVSYNEKHNEANCENNQDGNSNNESWNCGEEGPTTDPAILKLRAQQMRNFHTALMVSIGTPMLWMGDEYGHTKEGNNNSYCQDNEQNQFLWNLLSQDQGYTRFYKQMILFRKRCSLFHKTTFLTDQDILWHGKEPMKANWGADNRLVAYTLVHPENKGSLYIAFNAYSEPVELHLPPRDHGWSRVVDTSLESPNDFLEHPELITSPYLLAGYAAVILEGN
ncbi:MAG: hypothetical protein RLZZ453_1314 [Chlamydiota bacterium]|jgi:isoamylase/glycogen operon protein